MFKLPFSKKRDLNLEGETFEGMEPESLEAANVPVDEHAGDFEVDEDFEGEHMEEGSQRKATVLKVMMAVALVGVVGVASAGYYTFKSYFKDDTDFLGVHSPVQTAMASVPPPKAEPEKAKTVVVAPPAVKPEAQMASEGEKPPINPVAQEIRPASVPAPVASTQSAAVTVASKPAPSPVTPATATVSPLPGGDPAPPPQIKAPEAVAPEASPAAPAAPESAPTASGSQAGIAAGKELFDLELEYKKRKILAGIAELDAKIIESRTKSIIPAPPVVDSTASKPKKEDRPIDFAELLSSLDGSGSVEGGASKGPKRPVVTAVSNGSAIVNGNVVHVGSMVGGFKVVKINGQKGSVTLSSKTFGSIEISI